VVGRNGARRFLFSTTAGYGHFHPLVPLARALQKAGHACYIVRYGLEDALPREEERQG
jgi:hypothetical protein